MDNKTYYDELDVARTASTEVISAAYQALAKKYQVGVDAQDSFAIYKMQRITLAYETLSQPLKRQEYDMWLAQQNSQTQPYQQTQFQTFNESSQNQEPKYQPYPQQTSQEIEQEPKPVKKSSSVWAVLSIIALALLGVVGYVGYKITRPTINTPTTYEEPASAPTVMQDLPNSATTPASKPVSAEQSASQATPASTTSGITGFATEPMPNPNDTETSEQASQVRLKQIKSDYLQAIDDLNAIWNSLDVEIRNDLRATQRSMNNKREKQCLNEAMNTDGNKYDREIARYECEIPLIKQRAEDLKNYQSAE